MRQLAILTLFLSGIALGCGQTITGNGNIVEESRELSNFQSLVSAGSIDIKIIPGEAYGVKIVGDENVIPFVEAGVDGDALEVKFKDGVNILSSSVHVEVTAPFLNSIKTAGSGDITSEGTITNSKSIELSSAGSGDIRVALNSPAVKVRGAGSGDFVLSGQTRDLEYKGAGSCDFDSQNLLAENADVSVAGSGNIKVYASNTLKASITGSGNILYWGNPSLEGVNVAGSGKVKAGE